jgi:hypothetical protein
MNPHTVTSLGLISTLRNSEPLSSTHPVAATPEMRSIELFVLFPRYVITPLETPFFYCVLFISLLISTTFVLTLCHFVAILAHS